jgi:hypothetical protein
MFKLMRTVMIKPGPAAESFQIAQGIAEYLNKKYSTNVKVFMPVFSNLPRIIWFSEYENLGIIEEIGQKLRADADYLTLVNKLADKVIEGSPEDELFQSLL